MEEKSSHYFSLESDLFDLAKSEEKKKKKILIIYIIIWGFFSLQEQ